MVRCYKCHLEKDPSEFWKNCRRRNGLCSSCKECQREYNRRPEVLARRPMYKKNWMANGNNHEKSVKACRDYKIKNPDIIRKYEARRSEDRRTNGDVIRSKERSWYDKNKNSVMSKRGSPHVRFIRAKYEAKKRNLEWSISEDLFTRMISLACSYCCGPLPQNGCGLDRKTNSIGYTESNITPCCFVCNKVKSDIFTYDEMNNNIGPAVRRVRELRGGKFVLKYFSSRSEVTCT